MMKNALTTAVSVLAIAGTIACGNNNRATDTNKATVPAAAPATDQKAENQATPITVTGCLQHDGGTYIVTRLNEPSRKGVGTSGSATAVEHEQLREASNAYRVDPKQDTDLDKMVGKQVTVSGTVEDKANLPQASGTSGQSAASNRADIDRGDLAKISAETVSVVATTAAPHRLAKATQGGGKETSLSRAHARPANSRVSVWTFTFSPSLMKSGTRIARPVSSVAARDAAARSIAPHAGLGVA